MPLKVPKTIKIGPQEVRVVRNNTLLDDSALGRYHLYRQLIEYTENNVHPAQVMSTLVHESLHAILRVYGVMDVMGLPRDREEALVLALETPLVAFIKDNPKLVAMIQKVK